MELRIAGLNYRDIVVQLRNELGDRLPPAYSEWVCSKDVQQSLNIIKKEVREKASEMIELELLRLDQLEMIMLNKAMAGDVKAANMVLRIMERRSKYLGLDKPSEVKIKDWRSEIIDLLKAGKVTVEDIRRELGDELARQVLDAGGNSFSESRETQDDEPIEGEVIQDGLAVKTLALGGESTDPVP